MILTQFVSYSFFIFTSVVDWGNTNVNKFRLAVADQATPSGSGSPRVYTQLTGVGPIPPVQTPIVHHPLVPVYPQSESSTVSLSFPSFIHRQTIPMLFQCTLPGSSLLGRCHWAGTTGICGAQFVKSWPIPVSESYVSVFVINRSCYDIKTGSHMFHLFPIVAVVAMSKR